MKTQVSVLLSLFTMVTLSAQVQWRGGFPGHETEWQNARNWSDNRVPNEMDNVVIPDCSARGCFYPVVETKTALVQSLEIYDNARLTITEGAKLTVLGYGLPGGAFLNLGTVVNNGTLEVVEPVMHAIEYSSKGTMIHRRSDLEPDLCTVDCHQ